MNKEIEEKNEQIEKLEKQINNLKENLDKKAMENSELKEKLQLMQSGKDEGLLNTLDNLREELKDKQKQIQNLINENKKIRNSIQRPHSNINKINNQLNDEEEKEIDLNNKSTEHNPFRPTMNSQGLTDADKIRLYKERIKEYELTIESDKIQMKALKEDIKALKGKVKYLETFGGQIKDINEFVSLLNQILIGFKQKNMISISSDRNSYNALYTAVLFFYLDFGILGVIFLPFFFGMVFRYLIKLVYLKNNVAILSLASYGSQAIHREIPIIYFWR